VKHVHFTGKMLK